MNSPQDTSRSMRRLASLYNDIVLVQLEAIYWEVLVDDYLAEDGTLCLVVQPCRKPREEVPLFGLRVSKSRKKTALSVNQCVSAIDFNTAWLAFCVEGLDFDIKEVTFQDPKPAHRVQLWRCGNGHNEERLKTEYPHTVIKFVPNEGKEAIVADATYAQYSFDDGIGTYKTYCATRVHCADEGRMQEDDLGRSFEDFAAFEGHSWEQSCSDAIICTTNNVMVRELDAVGGINAILKMGAEEFQQVEDGVLAALKRETDMLRDRLEWIYFGDSDWFLMQLADVVKDADGAGHQACMQSYQRRGQGYGRILAA
ncbi:hypothetical protein N0V95_007697 [Ascochyta clinopodiicola]|nr:hypothetical protein N0V95_007697 [Ascochyta clinopodiicola]